MKSLTKKLVLNIKERMEFVNITPQVEEALDREAYQEQRSDDEQRPGEPAHPLSALPPNPSLPSEFFPPRNTTEPPLTSTKSPSAG